MISSNTEKSPSINLLRHTSRAWNFILSALFPVSISSRKVDKRLWIKIAHEFADVLHLTALGFMGGNGHGVQHFFNEVVRKTAFFDQLRAKSHELFGIASAVRSFHVFFVICSDRNIPLRHYINHLRRTYYYAFGDLAGGLKPFMKKGLRIPKLFVKASPFCDF